jgi:hypothetical protein
MKILRLSLRVLLFGFICLPLSADAIAKMPMAAMPKIEVPNPPQNQVLITRLAEINAMDKSDCNFSEKRALRKEKRSIKKRLSSDGGGIYISVGALLIVIILLILLL